MAAQSMDVETMPQLVLTSSAALEESEVLHTYTAQAREGTCGDSMLFIEWAAPDDVDIADRSWWYRANPGLGIRISEDYIASMEYPPKLDVESFKTERLGVAKRPAGIGGAVISAEDWDGCEDTKSALVDPVAFAVDCTPDQSWTSIGAAGLRDDGRLKG